MICCWFSWFMAPFSRPFFPLRFALSKVIFAIKFVKLQLLIAVNQVSGTIDSFLDNHIFRTHLAFDLVDLCMMKDCKIVAQETSCFNAKNCFKARFAQRAMKIDAVYCRYTKFSIVLAKVL